MKRIVLVSDTDYGILTRGFLARLFPPRYGRRAVIEANPFFASSIYSPAAVEAIAQALGESRLG